MRYTQSAFLVIALLGCSSATERESTANAPRDPLSSATGSESGNAVRVRPLVQSHFSGVVDPTRSLITDNAAFTALWAQVYRNLSEVPPLPTIDFSQEMLIVAGMGMRTSGGYAIAVDSVTSSDSELKIFVSSTSPGPDCATTGALTHPVAIVAVPRSSTAPRFIESAAQRSC